MIISKKQQVFMDEMTVQTIKELYKDLKSRREVLNWGEFANKVGCDRTYLSAVLNGHDPLTDDLKKKIASAFPPTTKLVGKVDMAMPLPLGDLQVTLKDHFDLLNKHSSMLQRLVESKLLNSETLQSPDQSSQETKRPRIFGKRPYPSKSKAPGQAGGKDNSVLKDRKNKG